MKNINITKELAVANAITHGGVFHADEVMATVILSKILPELKVCRTFKVPEGLADDVIVYDIGGGKFDHHQRGGNGSRENGVPFSSAGLIWREFGKQILKESCNPDLVWSMVDQSLIQGIDAIDNGVMPKPDYPAQAMSLSGLISGFNPTWDSPESADEAFEKAVEVATTVFDNVVANAESKAKAQAGVERAIEASANGIMVLDQFMPWQEYVLTSQNEKAEGILYVVFPSNRGGYNVQAVPESLGSFAQRKPLPESWAGLNGSALAEASGVQSATFCHPGRFICSAGTFQDAMSMAQKAIDA